MKLKKNITWNNFFKNNNGNTYPNNFVIRLVLNQFKHLKKKSRKKINILDLGSGTGSNFFFLKKEGFNAHAIDISTNAIKKIRKEKILRKIRIAKKNIQLSTFHQLPFDDKLFDMIVDCTSLQHCEVSNIKKSFLEVSRVMKNDGCFISIYEKKINNKFISTNKIRINRLKTLLKKNFKKINIGFIEYKFGFINCNESFYVIQCLKK
jgi:ubiquinone/menaquinone biosynthesis C-methylase UbiE